MVSLYDNIVSLCNNLGITPGKMCNDLHISRSMITDLKMGRKKSISANHLGKISAYLGVTIDELLGLPNSATYDISASLIEQVESHFKDESNSQYTWELTDNDDGKAKKAPTETSERKTISDEAHHIGELFDMADEADKVLTHNVLDKYDVVGQITVISKKKKNAGGFIEFDVYDEPAAAGLGNYLDVPQSHREQLPAFVVPKGASFGIRISGDSMEPAIADGSTVFVKHTMTVESGKVGVFVLNGASYCKQLIVDKAKREVRLHSLNPKYEDIVVTAADDLRTIGQVL